jgi:hypothetical protein
MKTPSFGSSISAIFILAAAPLSLALSSPHCIDDKGSNYTICSGYLIIYTYNKVRHGLLLFALPLRNLCKL